ncbi:50S ribosomal protein L23, partial [Candidatus Woesearchaeota archaeon CG10_big_fil_rev_8_21_14_0_10_45_5]
VEEAFKVKVIDVNFLNDMKGNKKAYVRLSGDTPAIDIATQLGMM